jgi:hypothetical protein
MSSRLRVFFAIDPEAEAQKKNPPRESNLVTEPTLIRQWGAGGVWSRCTAAEAEVVKPWDYTTIRFMI